MQLPNLIHPKTFTVNGARFRVVTYEPVTDEQARKIIGLFLSGPHPKIQKGKLYTALYNNSGGTLF